MIITDVKASLLQLMPNRMGGRGLFVLVKVHTDEGITGFGGQMVPWGGWVDYVNEVVKPFIINEVVDPFDVEKFADTYRFSPPGSGISPRPCSVEVALWDIIGKSTKQPIYKLFGARQHKVMAYSTIFSSWKPDIMAKTAIEYVELGFKAIKLRKTTGDVNNDLNCIKNVRDAIGYDTEIIVDAAQAWVPKSIYNFRMALKMARGLDKYEATWFEEPFSYLRKPKEMAKLVASVDVPIAGGGQVFGAYTYKYLLENNILDIVQPDIMHCGGIQEARKTAQFAEALDKIIVPHSGLGPQLIMAQNLQVIGSVPNAPKVEYGLKETEMELVRELGSLSGAKEGLIEHIPVEDGYIKIPNKPGLGVKLNEEFVKKHTIK